MQKTVYLTPAEVRALPEYSCTLPTGTTVGKKWKRHEPYRRHCQDDPGCGHWFLGEYVDIGKSDEVGIIWRKIQADQPPVAAPPRPRQAWSPETD